MAQQISLPFDVKCLGCKWVTCYTVLRGACQTSLNSISQTPRWVCLAANLTTTEAENKAEHITFAKWYDSREVENKHSSNLTTVKPCYSSFCRQLLPVLFADTIKWSLDNIATHTTFQQVFIKRKFWFSSQILTSSVTCIWVTSDLVLREMELWTNKCYCDFTKRSIICPKIYRLQKINVLSIHLTRTVTYWVAGTLYVNS
jgi:hypothetical protein